MKLSEFIALLNAELEKRGDVEVSICDDWGYSEPTIAERGDGKGILIS